MLLWVALAAPGFPGTGGGQDSQVSLTVSVDPRSRLSAELESREKGYQQRLERLESRIRWQIERIATRRQVLQSDEKAALDLLQREGREWSPERRELLNEVLDASRRLDFVMRSLEETYDLQLRRLLEAGAVARELRLEVRRDPEWPEDVSSKRIAKDLKKLEAEISVARRRHKEAQASVGSLEDRFATEQTELEELRRADLTETLPPSLDGDDEARALAELKDEQRRLGRSVAERSAALSRAKLDLLTLDSQQQADRIKVLELRAREWRERQEEVAARERGGVLARTQGPLSAGNLKRTYEHSLDLLLSPAKTISDVTDRLLHARSRELAPWLLVLVVGLLSVFVSRYFRGRLRKWETKGPAERVGVEVGIRSLGVVPFTATAAMLVVLDIAPAVLDRAVWFVGLMPLTVVAARAVFTGVLGEQESRAGYFLWLLWIAVLAAFVVQAAGAALPVFDYPPATSEIVNAAFALVLLLAWLGLLTRKGKILHFLGAEEGRDDIGIVRRTIRRLYRLLAVGPIVVFGLYVAGYENLSGFLFRGGVVTILVLLAAPWGYDRSTTGVQKVLGYPGGGGPFGMSPDAAQAAYRAIFPVLLLSVGILAALLVASGWGYGGLLRNLGDTLTYPLLEVGGSRVSVVSLVLFVATISVAITVTRWLMFLLNAQVYDVYGLDKGARATVDTLFRYLMFVVGTIVALDVVGIGVGALTVFAGVVGIGIGFGSQKIAANFISGVILLATRPVRVDDWVEVAGAFGCIEKISSFATTLRTERNQLVVIPNADLVGQKLVNFHNTPAGAVRLDTSVVVGLGSDPGLVVELLEKAATLSGVMLEGSRPSAVYTGADELGQRFMIRMMVRPPPNAPKASILLREAGKLFAEHGIEMPVVRRELITREGK